MYQTKNYGCAGGPKHLQVLTLKKKIMKSSQKRLRSIVFCNYLCMHFHLTRSRNPHRLLPQPPSAPHYHLKNFTCSFIFITHCATISVPRIGILSVVASHALSAQFPRKFRPSTNHLPVISRAAYQYIYIIGDMAKTRVLECRRLRRALPSYSHQTASRRGQ